LLGDLDLDCPACGRPLHDVVELDLGDVGAALRLNQDESLIGEAINRRRHRQARYAETGAELVFVDRRCRQEFAGDDGPLEREIDLVGPRQARWHVPLWPAPLENSNVHVRSTVQVHAGFLAVEGFASTLTFRT
jgi:hypothetical protein